jgi:hypothetical protein
MNSCLKNLIYTAGAAVVLMAAKRAQSAPVLSSLPLWFESSGPDNTMFKSHTRGAEFQVTSSGAEFDLHKPGSSPATVRMTFVGADADTGISAGQKLAGTINYLTGDAPAQWRTKVAAYDNVRLQHVYPGIDVVYYGDDKNLEYDFNVAVGASPDTIAIRFDGSEKISINTCGQLVIQAGGGEIIQHKPDAYQTVSGKRQAVEAGYKILDTHTVALKVGAFNHALPLVIDPVLGYSTYFGGNYGEIIHAVAVGADDSIYVAGETLSTKVTNSVLLATTGAYQTNFAGGTVLGDSFVAKFDATGTNMLYFTYLGGVGNDTALGLAVDAAGDAYVTGFTDSSDFPHVNALYPGIAGKRDSVTGHYPVDAFVAELNPAGNALKYSTYLGGDAADVGTAIAVDQSSGIAYVAGYTYSTNLPVTSDALQKKLACTNTLYYNANAFVAQIAANGAALTYLSYLGGTNIDEALGIALDTAKNIYVCGQTRSINFTNLNSIPGFSHLNGSTNKVVNSSDAFVTRFQPGFAGIDYSTFLGGTNDDEATGIAVDGANNAYVVGLTVSTNFPNSTNGVQLSSFVRTNTAGLGIATNSFLTKISWNGVNASNSYSQIFGGNGYDVANGVALDASGNIFIVGTETSRTNYNAIGMPIFGSLHATNSSSSGLSDVVVTVFKSDFSSLIYSACLGGQQSDFGNAIAVDNEGNAIIVGQTISTNFPTFGSWTTNLTALHRHRNGTNDAFIARILTATSPMLHAAHSGTNFLVFWPPVSDVTSSNVSIESATNLLMTVKTITISGTNKSTNYVTEGTTNWVIITNPAPVLTNGNYTITFNPTNAMQFYRFHSF